ncbi:cadherin-like domain-containing protein [Alteromonas ponticola]|uniref:Cadherin-like domain-containing protein n=1 Tax=Alteromonas aquimaris TaxID=2998417 RepID=A0ABT3P4C5_9ALTE|nr:hypothetical protein [Alteromonas aquimaris]MCW8106966.1 cadherin-like domain-containing protein [Alteromonas aquimaris]
MKYTKLISILMVSTILAACGGGGGGGDAGGGGGGGGGGGNPPANQAPTITVDESFDAEANTEITITATASDSDGQIDTYLWEVTSSQTISLSGEDTRSVTFTTPDVNSTEDVELRLTVTDDDGASASANVTVTVFPEGEVPPPTAKATLTVQGNVLDSSDISTITVLLNGEEFAADIDMPTNTTYEATLEVEGAAREGYLTIKGTGTGANAHVGLISLVGKVNDLIVQAQGDATLTDDENFMVNLSALTTAKYSLFKQQVGSSVTSTDAYLKGMSNFKTITYHDWASAIVVANAHGDASGALGLPSGVSNTVELAESPVLMTTYLEDIFYSAEFSGNGSETGVKAALFTDSVYFNEVSKLSAPFTLYFNPQDGLNYTVRPLNGLSHSMVFDADGTGRMNQYSFTWTFNAFGDTNEGVYLATFDDEGHAVSTSSGGGEIKFGIASVAILLLDEPVDGRANVYVITDFEEKVGSGSFNIVSRTQDAINVSVKTEDLPELSSTVYLPLPKNKLNASYALNNSVTLFAETQYETFKLNSNNTGKAVLTDQDITWDVTDDALKITGMKHFSDSNPYFTVNDTLSYKVVTSREGHQIVSATVEKDGESDHHLISTGTGVLNGNVVAWDAAKVPGFYVGNFKSVGSTPYDGFYLELKENGDANDFTTRDINQDGMLKEADSEVTAKYGKWEIVGNSLVIKTFDKRKIGDSDPSCRELNETTGCRLAETRTWTKVYESEDQLILLNSRYQHRNDIAINQQDLEVNSILSISKSNSAPFEIVFE